MILVDFECPECGHIFEEIVHQDRLLMPCPRCKIAAKRIITTGRVYSGNQDADWIKSVREVVDKDSGKPHCQEFLKNPTRANYEKWMKGERLRPFETNEPLKPPPVDTTKLQKEMLERQRQRNRIEVR